MHYLGSASTFVLVIDPLSIARFWDNLPSARRDQLMAYRSEAPHPDLVYQQTAERIAQFGSRHARRRLAIVFSRADLVLVSKTDLLPYVDFDSKRHAADVRKTAPDALMLQVSAATGAGASWPRMPQNCS